MRFQPVLKILGFMILAVGFLILTAIPFSLYYGEDFNPLLSSGLVTVFAGLILTLLFRRSQVELRSREALFIVGIGWVAASIFGSLPYILSGVLPSFTDAFFETISGYTTTGASVIRNVEVVPHGILYWRALSNWVGGMGIIVLSLTVLPLLGMSGKQLFKAEVSGPTKDKLTPRLVETARVLWGLYVLVTVAETIFLMAGGMSFFDALCHSFSTIATGGFSTKNASVGYYNSVYIEVVVIIFMLIGGSNFALHYAVLKNGVAELWRDNEFVFFVFSYLVALSVITVITVLTTYDGHFLQALRGSAFSVMTVMSTTGFATADFAAWAPPAQIILLFLMFPGALAGSTGGGIKNVRVLLLFKAAFSEVKRLLHPKIVAPVRLNGIAVEQTTLITIGGFVILYLITFTTAAIVLSMTGLDIVTSMSAVAACLSNEGPGLSSVGPMGNYADLTAFAKWVLGGCMLIGRLEIFTIFALFSSSFWRR
ncbi:MAG: TrkH family potassium uptake protein [Ignavibacteriales bacterium]|nr:TrkH family potassium uptake protein [Ignavibacteriales bacterium]